MKSTLLLSTFVLAACAAAPAMAQSKGDWTLGVGIHAVNPDADSGKLVNGTLPVNIESSVRPTFTGEYFIADHLGIELLASTPFKHTINAGGLGRIGTAKQLPPTLSLQYHFNDLGRFSPFVGVGLNYTTFFDEDAAGPLDGQKLKLGDSWGAAAHVGVDIAVNDNSAFRIDARWIDIDTDVKLDGQNIGTAHVDPTVYGVAYVITF
ncbi:OmpW/AlkL family protein [Pseudoxanthomonas dokdonensis]|uniref:Membrane protein n=1 Tax=Pseudoxanthomonas dokdonensis TaxID=344882 RepID=A0A0R0CYK0_9GAMM|nr:OmpW family outer membrane protein [Pseudoxanthomonas dokdonensis]KRG70200.1 membrane protein [Pseudoxanthomonas dokdonensis]